MHSAPQADAIVGREWLKLPLALLADVEGGLAVRASWPTSARFDERESSFHPRRSALIGPIRAPNHTARIEGIAEAIVAVLMARPIDGDQPSAGRKSRRYKSGDRLNGATEI